MKKFQISDKQHMEILSRTRHHVIVPVRCNLEESVELISGIKDTENIHIVTRIDVTCTDRIRLGEIEACIIGWI